MKLSQHVQRKKYIADLMNKLRAIHKSS